MKLFLGLLAIVLVQSLANGEGEKNCRDPKCTGPCKALIYRYYFDSASGECLEFVYGGCQPNGNNFETIEECLATCGQRNGEQPPAPEVPSRRRQRV